MLSTLEYHKTSDCMLHVFLQVSQGKQQRVDVCISTANQKQTHVFFSQALLNAWNFVGDKV